MGDGSPLQAARLALGMTQEKLAGLVGVSPGHVSLVERGRRLPSMKLLAQLFAHLQLAPDARAEVVAWLVSESRQGHEANAGEVNP